VQMPSHLYETYQFRPGRRGLYESNYIKANSPDGQRAVWIKHNVLAWKNPARQAIIELWCVLFEKGRPPRVVKEDVPVDRVVFAEDSIGLVGDDILISPQRTATRVRDGIREASWEIDIEVESGSVGEPLIHFPYARMYELPFPKKKVLTPAPRTRWNGRLTFADETIEIEDWIGFRNHNWGTEHAFCYAYGNCNHFPDDPDVIFDGFSAKIRLGPWWKSPFLSMAILREGAIDHGFHGVKEAIISDVQIDFPVWQLKLRIGEQELCARQESEIADFVGLPYHHPNGNLSYCYNSKFARTTLEWTGERGRRRKTESNFGELEFLFDTPLPNVPVYRTETSRT
jgi:hypothetical protein